MRQPLTIALGCLAVAVSLLLVARFAAGADDAIQEVGELNQQVFDPFDFGAGDAVQEIGDLNQHVFELHRQGRYQEALPLAE